MESHTKLEYYQPITTQDSLQPESSRSHINQEPFYPESYQSHFKQEPESFQHRNSRQGKPYSHFKHIKTTRRRAKQKTVNAKHNKNPKERLRPPEFIRKQYLRKELRTIMRSIKVGRIVSTDNIASASSILQSRITEPSELDIARKLERREYLIRDKKLDRIFLKNCGFEMRPTIDALSRDFHNKATLDDDIEMEDIEMEEYEDIKMATNKNQPKEVGGNVSQLDDSNIGHRMLQSMGWKEDLFQLLKSKQM
ncbi:hypothetical protein K501DRAFT_300745 [Backusella circina FSU 941]|nr:hypothetical protein K501DRAFT_300745 [Backusella circina FSU 941]